MRLEGKVAVITGAGSGIGLAMTELFVAEGAEVVAADVSQEGLGLLRGLDGVSAVAADVSKAPDVERLIVTASERHGRLDVLCNNAGIVDMFLPAAETEDRVWERVLAVNLSGPFFATRLAVPLMLDTGGGAIVNTASVAGLFGGRGGAAYTVSKHGLIGLTKNVAATYGRDGVRCVAICPGAVDTGIDMGSDVSEQGMATLNRTLPANPRAAVPAEIARLALFAASDEASFVNGAVLVADGGWTVH